MTNVQGPGWKPGRKFPLLIWAGLGAGSGSTIVAQACRLAAAKRPNLEMLDFSEPFSVGAALRFQFAVTAQLKRKADCPLWAKGRIVLPEAPRGVGIDQLL
jgi:hypothetical protein